MRLCPSSWFFVSVEEAGVSVFSFFLFFAGDRGLGKVRAFNFTLLREEGSFLTVMASANGGDDVGYGLFFLCYDWDLNCRT